VLPPRAKAAFPLVTLGFRTYQVSSVIWDGQYREIYVNESETFPLIGMRLLRGYDLRIQAIEGGTVAIEALSNVRDS
jgi:hypothetical protein